MYIRGDSDNDENTSVSAANIRCSVFHVLDPVPSGEDAFHMPTQRKGGWALWDIWPTSSPAMRLSHTQDRGCARQR